MLLYLGHLGVVDPEALAPEVWEISVTCPLPLNTQPVAGTIATTSGLDGGLAALPSERCSCVVISEMRVSNHTTSVLRGS